MSDLTVVDQIRGGQAQAVAISQTSQVVSNAFEIGSKDSLNLVWRIDCTVTSGTAAIVKLQQSIDQTAAHFVDVDSTNAKVTLAATGTYQIVMSSTATNFLAKMPLCKYLRFVCTTTSSDAVVITHCWVQLHK